MSMRVLCVCACQSIPYLNKAENYIKQNINNESFCIVHHNQFWWYFFLTFDNWNNTVVICFRQTYFKFKDQFWSIFCYWRGRNKRGVERRLDVMKNDKHCFLFQFFVHSTPLWLHLTNNILFVKCATHFLFVHLCIAKINISKQYCKKYIAHQRTKELFTFHMKNVVDFHLLHLLRIKKTYTNNKLCTLFAMKFVLNFRMNCGRSPIQYCFQLKSVILSAKMNKLSKKCCQQFI